jgi:exodeoxyribonuclease VII large subunit
MNERIKTDKATEPLSVSSYIESLNRGLEKFYVRMIGEVSEFKLMPGYAFFTLKDKNENGVISCFIWRSDYNLAGVELKEGLEVIVSGHSAIYPKSGRLNFQTSTIELVGEGAIKEAYEKLKKKLSAEGIFAKEKKRALPDYIQNIGVITSKTGAVIHDFTTNLGKFGFKVKMIDSRVEGQKAVKDLLASIKSFEKKDIEVLVIMRGGGSLESLLAFNNEELVREIRNFPIPVIAAIGHDKDIPLMSLAADAMTSTPTAAANLLNESWEKAQFKVEKYERSILNSYSNSLFKANNLLDKFIYRVKEEFDVILYKYKEAENRLKFFLSRIEQVLILQEKNIIDYSKSIQRNFISMIGDAKYEIKNIEKAISSYNPERQLKLGYSIARHNGKLIKSVKNVNIGEDIDVQVSDGSIQSKIINK